MVGEDQADHRHLIAGLQCCHWTGIALPCSADRKYTIDRLYSKTQLYVQLWQKNNLNELSKEYIIQYS